MAPLGVLMILSGGLLIYWTFKHGKNAGNSSGISVPTGLGGLPIIGPGGLPVITVHGIPI